MPNTARPGWYYAEGDPPNTERFWDGTAWTFGPRPIGGMAAAAAPPPVQSTKSAVSGPSLIGGMTSMNSRAVSDRNVNRAITEFGWLLSSSVHLVGAEAGKITIAHLLFSLLKDSEIQKIVEQHGFDTTAFEKQVAGLGGQHSASKVSVSSSVSDVLALALERSRQFGHIPAGALHVFLALALLEPSFLHQLGLDAGKLQKKLVTNLTDDRTSGSGDSTDFVDRSESAQVHAIHGQSFSGKPAGSVALVLPAPLLALSLPRLTCFGESFPGTEMKSKVRGSNPFPFRAPKGFEG